MEMVSGSLLAAALCLGTGYFLLVFEAIMRMKTSVTAWPKLQFLLVERHFFHRRQTRDEHAAKRPKSS